MHLWFDLLLAVWIVWETLAGYLFGTKVAFIRACTVIAALLIALPFAANCAVYLRPALEPAFRAAIGEKVVAASTGQGGVFLGPWQSVIGVPVGPGTLLSHRLLRLAVNVTGLSFLVLTVHLGYRLLERKRGNGAPVPLGAVVGFAGGLLSAMVALALSPVLVLGFKGTLVSSAVHGSVFAKTFAPLIQGLVNFIAPFVD